jgi:hypothetical protein
MDLPLSDSLVASDRPAGRVTDPLSRLGRLRWIGPLWLLIYIPSYAAAYGWANFLFLCNLGVGLTAAGLWFRNRLLLSSQAVAAMFIGVLWSVDFFGRLLLGFHPLGVTGYMWDPQYPLATRLLSLYHVVWPILLWVALRRVGYDRRGWPLQSAIAALVLVVCRLATGPVENVNYVFTDPLFGRTFGPPWMHVAVIWAVLAFVLYGATHLVLRRFLRVRST